MTMNIAYVSSDFLSNNDVGGVCVDGVSSYAVLHLSNHPSSSTKISTLLRIMPRAEENSIVQNTASPGKSILIHPILLKVLLHSQNLILPPETNHEESKHCVQVKSYQKTEFDDFDIGQGWIKQISIEEIYKRDLSSSNASENITINLQYMCSSSEEFRSYFKDATNESEAIQMLKDNLAGAVIAEGTIIGIDHGKNQAGSATQETSFFMVGKVDSSTRSCLRYVHLTSMIYNITLSLPTAKVEKDTPLNGDAPSQYSCPGYKPVLEELLNLATFRNSDGRPTAVILSGCAGVGKTRMATWLEDELTKTKQIASAKVSTKDILLEEASTTFEARRIIDELGQTHNSDMLIVIDDLDVILGEGNTTDSKHESEQFRAMNAIAKLIDEATDKFASACFILGLCRSSWAELPLQLARVGQFEKLVTIPSPTLTQRKEIFKYWLSAMPCSSDASTSNGKLAMDEWAELLTPRTAGCVAADIRRICADALTNANARAQQTSEGGKDAKVNWVDIKEAARRCIPSQLSSLDVIPSTHTDYDGGEKPTLQPKEQFNLAWKRFGGYNDEKKRLYTAIARPWAYHMSNADINQFSDSAPSTLGFSKPSGILFHGPSGCGKTAAALCLASSMGLHCVKVKASEVFNQWLGGSEANLRSIFSRARAASPCILFFDELDALAMNREQESDAMSGVQSRILTTLLNEMDGITNAGGKQDILVVAATNRLDAIDAALLRPGRLEEHVLLSYPTPETIKEILQLQTSNLPLDGAIDFEEMSHTFSDATCSCAEVEGICRDACLIAMRRSSKEVSSSVSNMYVTRTDFEEAFHRIKRRTAEKT